MYGICLACAFDNTFVLQASMIKGCKQKWCEKKLEGISSYLSSVQLEK
jgi:hypothetical protein